MYSKLTMSIAIVFACLSTVPGSRVGVQPMSDGRPNIPERLAVLEEQYGLNVEAGTLLYLRVARLEQHILNNPNTTGQMFIDRVRALESAANAARARDGTSFLQIHGDRPASHFDSETNANERRVSDEEHVDTDQLRLQVSVEEFQSVSEESVSSSGHSRDFIQQIERAISARFQERYELLMGFSHAIIMMEVQFSIYDSIFNGVYCLGSSPNEILTNILVRLVDWWAFREELWDHEQRIANGVIPNAVFAG